MSARLLALALVLAAGCAARATGSGLLTASVTAGQARARILYAPEDAGAARQVAAALVEALPRVGRWGGLDRPVTITIHHGHAALEEAVSRPGYPWLHAWARYATIDLQSPSTWSFLGASDDRVTELLTHELTHCVMYQRAATEATWSQARIPLWFQEGLASQTAGQGARWSSLEALWRYYLAGPPGADDRQRQPGELARVARGRSAASDPLAGPGLLYQDRPELVYGAAHQAVGFLVARYGEASIDQLLGRMRAGAAFPDAFRDTFGFDEAALLSDFRRYVVWEGWRR